MPGATWWATPGSVGNSADFYPSHPGPLAVSFRAGPGGAAAGL